MPFFACNRQVDVLDKRQCNLEVLPPEVERYARSLEELLLDMNHLKDLPRQIFRLHKLQKLGVSDNDLYRIPEEVAQLQNLVELNVSRNDISDIPDELRACKNLRVFDISSNPMARLPDSITQVVSLTHLNLSDTSLTKLPADIGNLCNLKSLEVRENHLHALPATLSMLVNLQQLDVGQNELDALPQEIQYLRSLRELYIDENHLEELPEGLLKCKLLEQLDVSNNKLMKLPEDLGELDHLTDLALSQNCLQQLPSSIRLLKRLSIFKVDNNNLMSLTPAIGSCTGLVELYLMHNLLEELPSSISNLKKLKNLNVDKNQLTSVPSLIGQCTALTMLSLRDNQLSELPMEIGQLENLRVLDLSNNNLKYLPFTINVLYKLQALWLNENQSQAMLKFQQTTDASKQMRVLTCYLLPQTKPNRDGPQIEDLQKPPNPGKGFVGGPKVHFGEGDVTVDDDPAAVGTASGSSLPNNFERHDTPHPKPKKASIDGHVIHHGTEQNHPTNLALTKKQSESERVHDANSNGPRSALKHPPVSQPFMDSPVSENGPSGATLSPAQTTTSSATHLPSAAGALPATAPPPPPPSASGPEPVVKQIVIRRSANAGLGLSIAGGLESTPFVGNDTGLFVSKLTPGGAAELAGLRVGDKLLEVNGTGMVNQRHDVAVRCMQLPVDPVVLIISRAPESPPMLPKLSAEVRSGTGGHTTTSSSLSTSISAESGHITSVVNGNDVITTTVAKDSAGSPGFSITQVEPSKEMVITGLKPGGAAEKDGKLRPGDVLLTVNGKSTRGMTMQDVSHQLTNIPGEVYVVVERFHNSHINSYGPSPIDNTVDTVELQRDSNHSLGLSIVGGIDHCSHPFGVMNPGVFISKIASDSPAAICGKLRIGDRILTVNRENVEKARHNEAVMALKHSGPVLRLTVRHEPQPRGLREVVFRRRISEPIGLSICGGINSPAANPNDSTDEGIFIEKVEPGSSADECGSLKPGLRILEINDDSLLGFTQVEAANSFRRADSVLRLLVCDGFNPEDKLADQVLTASTPSFLARKTVESSTTASASSLARPNGNSSSFLDNNNITKSTLNFSEPPLAASSPIPNGQSRGNNSYVNVNPSANVSSSTSISAVPKNIPIVSSPNTSASTSFGASGNTSSTFAPTKIPPAVAPKPLKPTVLPPPPKPINSVESPTSPETLNFSSKLKRFESEISTHSVSSSSSTTTTTTNGVNLRPAKKPLLSANDVAKIAEDAQRRPVTAQTPTSPDDGFTMSTFLNQALNTSTASNSSIPKVVRTKNAENRLAAASPGLNSTIDSSNGNDSQTEIDIKKRQEWRQARLASLDAESQRTEQLMKQITAKRLAHISEERSVSASPTTVIQNENLENAPKLDLSSVSDIKFADD
uniref:PDZ domain-containing protein n=1 Tax=Panagrellus redivivus TaxID=6233 RepID=A0A7E5A261_PANRE